VTPSGNGIEALEAARSRSRGLRWVAVALFALTIARLGWYQLARGGFYRELSEDNYVQGFVVRAPRGVILDRHGTVLADSRVSHSVTLSRRRGRDDVDLAKKLALLLELEEIEVAGRLAEARTNFYGSVTLVEDATFAQVSRIEERRSELPGVKVDVTAARRYPEIRLANHALGYVGEVSEVELETKAPLGYRSGDMIGKAGMERRYEPQLRGEDGIEYWVYDASGRELRPFGGHSREAKPGHDVILAIDAVAQRVADERLGEFAAGAIVALDPSNGDVLVFASHPGPDPNSLADGVSTSEWSELTSSPTHPLLNRTIQAAYPPASAFKLVTAAVGLETGIVAERREHVTCKGAYKYGIRTFRCWRAEGHGVVGLLDGIIESCDVFFYQLGARLGVSTLMGWTERSGLGRVTGVDVAGEVPGNVPTPRWYDRRYGRGKWSRGVVLNLAIGQGELLVTPIQAACLTAAIVNGGVAVTPHLLKQVQTRSGRVLGTPKRSTAYELPYSDETIDFLRRAMVGVVEAPNGTGKLARIPGIEVGGKTGTAQNPHGENHAWFIAFAPADDPEIAIAVIVENAGGGGAIAAPIARDVMKAYLRIEDAPPAVRPPETEPARSELLTEWEPPEPTAGEASVRTHDGHAPPQERPSPGAGDGDQGGGGPASEPRRPEAATEGAEGDATRGTGTQGDDRGP